MSSGRRRRTRGGAVLATLLTGNVAQRFVLERIAAAGAAGGILGDLPFAKPLVTPEEEYVVWSTVPLGKRGVQAANVYVDTVSAALLTRRFLYYTRCVIPRHAGGNDGPRACDGRW